MSYEKPDNSKLQESGYPQEGYYRICVFGPDDETYGLPLMDRLMTMSEIVTNDMTVLIADRIAQREEGKDV